MAVLLHTKNKSYPSEWLKLFFCFRCLEEMENDWKGGITFFP